MDRLSDYDYNLPETAIAQIPLEDRAASKLLWLHRVSGELTHHVFRDALDILQPGDLLVMNDTRVTALRLIGQKTTGGAVELLLLRELGPREFLALAKPGRRLQSGAVVDFGPLRATVVEVLGSERRVRFEEVPDFEGALRKFGSTPLPPYIQTALPDPSRYQTVYAGPGGSAAAPTAGLHLTPELLQELEQKGIHTAKVTLDVGIDTFRPVQTENLEEHKMHGEVCRVPEATAQAIADCKGRVIAVGTTTVRTLETMARGTRKVESGAAESRLFIRPGFRFQVIDGMFTNFHLPRTTMLLMISALSSRERVMNAYREALQCDYRFLSFGDSMLIL